MMRGPRYAPWSLRCYLFRHPQGDPLVSDYPKVTSTQPLLSVSPSEFIVLLPKHKRGSRYPSVPPKTRPFTVLDLTCSLLINPSCVPTQTSPGLRSFGRAQFSIGNSCRRKQPRETKGHGETPPLHSLPRSPLPLVRRPDSSLLPKGTVGKRTDIGSIDTFKGSVVRTPGTSVVGADDSRTEIFLTLRHFNLFSLLSVSTSRPCPHVRGSVGNLRELGQDVRGRGRRSLPERVRVGRGKPYVKCGTPEPGGPFTRLDYHHGGNSKTLLNVITNGSKHVLRTQSHSSSFTIVNNNKP